MIQLLRIPFNIGTLCGLIMFVLFVVLHYLHLSPLVFGLEVLTPVPIVGLVIASLRVKKRVLAGKITFRRVFYTSVITSFTAISLGCILMYLFMQLIDPSVLGGYFETMYWLEQVFHQEGKWMTEEIRNEQEKLMTAGNVSFAMFQLYFFVCSVVSILLGLIIKNQKWKPGIEQGEEPQTPDNF